MYAWLWQHLPGATPTRILLAVLLTAAVVALLFGVAFPWIDQHLAIDNGAFG